MNREEVEQILSEGSTNPKYQAALNIAKQNGWIKDINTTDAKMPSEKELKQKEKERKEQATREWMINRPDVQNAIRRSQIANPSVGVIDRVTGNVTGLNEDVLDPNAFKAKDLNADGSVKEKNFQLGNGSDGAFVGTEKKTQTSKGGTSAGTSDSGTLKQSSATANKQNADMQTQQKIERQTAQNNKEENWNNVLDSAAKLGKASKTVDDHYIENLPRGIINAYKSGEFGEPGSKEAKQRLGYFVVDALSSPLKALANGMSRFAGQGDRFADTESQAEKFNKTNLQNALENRWNKYKQETNNAMDLLKQRGFADEAIQETIDTVSANNRLQTAFNRATEEQKAYALEVLTEIGDKIGNMNDTEFVNTIMGMAAMGDSLDYKEAAGMLLYRFIKDPEKRKEALESLGFTSGSNSSSGSTGLKGAIVHELLN